MPCMCGCLGCAINIKELEKRIEILENERDGISNLFPGNAPHKHPETGVSLHDDIRELCAKLATMEAEQ